MGSRRDKNNKGGDFGFEKFLLPTFIGELEVSANIPADAGYIMPSSCRSHQHSLNEISANINTFDKFLSRILLSVSDFRMSQVEMEDGETPTEGAPVDVDPANITSEVRWNYALDFMEPAEIGGAILSSDSISADDKLIQVG